MLKFRGEWHTRIKMGFLGKKNLACKIQRMLGQMSLRQTLIAQ